MVDVSDLQPGTMFRKDATGFVILKECTVQEDAVNVLYLDREGCDVVAYQRDILVNILTNEEFDLFDPNVEFAAQKAAGDKGDERPKSREEVESLLRQLMGDEAFEKAKAAQLSRVRETSSASFGD